MLAVSSLTISWSFVLPFKGPKNVIFNIKNYLQRYLAETFFGAKLIDLALFFCLKT